MKPPRPLHAYWNAEDRLRLSKGRPTVRKPMTLCIAASCEDQDRKEPCIVVSSDWKAEVGDVASAEIQNKLYWMFDESWPTLIAGTASEAHDLIACYRTHFNRKAVTRANIGYRVRAAALKRKVEIADEYIQARLGFSYEYFRRHKAEIDPTVWSGIWNDIKKITLDCQLIICAFVNGLPLTYQIEEDGKTWRDDNFLAIGSGSTVANSLLCFRQQNEEMSLVHTLYNVYEATRFAHKAQVPGVGRQHAFSVLYAGKNGKVESHYVRTKCTNLLKSWYEQYGPKDTPDTLELPDKVFKRYRIGRV